MNLLIFDFDGTIVNSKQVYYSAINKQLAKYGFKKKQVDRAIDLGLNLSGLLKKFFSSSIYIWFLKKRIMNDVLKHVNSIKKCKDVNSIRQLKVRKILVSNSLAEFVLPVLKHLKLKKEFNEIYTADNFSDKSEFIKNYIRKNKIDKEECYYVGDRAVDVKLAREVGIKSIIIAGKCAWDSRKEILGEKPDFLISDLAEITKIV